jgi:hypothetical protein
LEIPTFQQAVGSQNWVLAAACRFDGLVQIDLWKKGGID